MRKYLAVLALVLSACSTARQYVRNTTPRFCAMTESEIAQALRQIHAENTTLQARMEAVSRALLGTPFRWGPLGEGPTSRFDRDPLYSFKEMDCTTMIETAMALSLEPDLRRALDVTLQHIRYKDGLIDYASRNHFPEVDWIDNNVKAGYLEDISARVAGADTRWMRKRISKRDWYARKTLNDLQGFDKTSEVDKNVRLAKFQNLADGFQDEVSSFPYVPIEMLPQALARVPSGAIANVVREDMPDKIVAISHQVLVIQKPDGPYVRHAALNRQVEDVPALEYFGRYADSKWRLAGVNFDVLREPAVMSIQARKKP